LSLLPINHEASVKNLLEVEDKSIVTETEFKVVFGCGQLKDPQNFISMQRIASQKD